MLKTLEEPPPFAHLLLLTSRPANVLPTIASRCQPVRFDAPSSEAIAERLGRHGVAPDVARACGRLALGDSEVALRLALGDGPALRAGAERLARAAIADRLADRPWLELLANARGYGDVAAEEVRERVVADLDLLPPKERKRAEREGEEQSRRAHRRAHSRSLDEALQLTGLWLRDVACLAAGAEDLVHHSDRLEPLREDAARAAPDRLREGVVAVDEARASLALNPTEELVLEALAYRLARTLRA
jgi:DNA polymerase-3 subunit delta'